MHALWSNLTWRCCLFILHETGPAKAQTDRHVSCCETVTGCLAILTESSAPRLIYWYEAEQIQGWSVRIHDTMSWNQFSTFQTVTVKQEGHHAVVTLARPNRSNALDDLMWAEIPQVARNQGCHA